MFDIKSAVRRIIDGCAVRADNGITLYTPDGQGNYRALWTRDFAYMAEYAGEFFTPQALVDCVEYLLYHCDTDGWVPDRVDRKGRAFYTAGGSDFPALRNLDNGPFLVFAAEAALRKHSKKQADTLFSRWRDRLTKGLDCLPLKNGLIYNDPEKPHSPYGFTDCICKTGLLSMESLLLWHALKMLYNHEVNELEQRISDIEKNLSPALSCKKTGMLLGGTVDCRQIDIWASVYAVSVNFPLSQDQKDAIADYIAENYEALSEFGQLRHTEPGKAWEKTIIPVDVGTYQNGAFWATPIKWLVDTLKEKYPELAAHAVTEMLEYFEKYGIFECVNGEYRKLDTYVASATNAYAAFLSL